MAKREKINFLSLTEASFPKELQAIREEIRILDKGHAEKRAPLMAKFKPLADAYVTSKLATFAAGASNTALPEETRKQCAEALSTLRCDEHGKVDPAYGLTYSFRYGVGVAAAPISKSKSKGEYAL